MLTALPSPLLWADGRHGALGQQAESASRWLASSTTCPTPPRPRRWLASTTTCPTPPRPRRWLASTTT
eukprot:293472-Heterocapsa_arctica.AAC.1